MRTAAYEERDRLLLTIGFSNYVNYLKSALWEAIRARVLKKHPRCIVCQHDSMQVHHQGYSLDTLRGRRLDELVAMCRECHKLIEFDEHGNKTSLADANNRLKMLLRYSTQQPPARPKRSQYEPPVKKASVYELPVKHAANRIEQAAKILASPTAADLAREKAFAEYRRSKMERIMREFQSKTDKATHMATKMLAF